MLLFGADSEENNIKSFSLLTVLEWSVKICAKLPPAIILGRESIFSQSQIVGKISLLGTAIELYPGLIPDPKIIKGTFIPPSHKVAFQP